MMEEAADIHIARDQLPYATPPFSYEYIATRERMKWRVKDAKDNAMGCGETEEAASFICDFLNRAYP